MIPSNLKGEVCLNPCNPDIFNLHYVPRLEQTDGQMESNIKPDSLRVYSGWFLASQTLGGDVEDEHFTWILFTVSSLLPRYLDSLCLKQSWRKLVFKWNTSNKIYKIKEDIQTFCQYLSIVIIGEKHTYLLYGFVTYTTTTTTIIQILWWLIDKVEDGLWINYHIMNEVACCLVDLVYLISFG